VNGRGGEDVAKSDSARRGRRGRLPYGPVERLGTRAPSLAHCLGPDPWAGMWQMRLWLRWNREEGDRVRRGGKRKEKKRTKHF
jgi:hypothetical protein